MTQDGMVNVTINGVAVRAQQGRLLIDVAEELGVFVPRFCYHPGMKSVAVCRMCLVRVEGLPKLAPACATPVTDGMVVDTVDEQAVDAQQGMLEFLLINHPLDCPICDRGGECPLQDQTYRHGSGQSRYIESKRHFEKPLEISELVVLDRERCVLCWRCVRFADEIAGDRFIQLVDRGDGTQILTFNDEPFDSYFSGNTIQICPVGALTSRPYRFVARPWDLKTAPSVCAYCSVGCPVTNEARAGKLVRVQALPNENVNDFWICDKGRFAYHYVSAQDRLATPLVRDGDGFKQTSWGEALLAAAQGLRGGRVGVIAGGHLTTEDGYAVGRLAREVLETPDVDARIQDAGAPYELAVEFGGAAGSTATFNDLLDAKTIVWCGPDPKETVPVAYLRLRKAVQDNQARLVVVSARRTSLDEFGTVLRCSPDETPAAMARIEQADVERPAVVCWGPSSPGRDERTEFGSSLKLARALDAKLLVCPPHAGSQGMIDMGVHPALAPGYQPVPAPGRDTRAILEAAEAGDIDALLIVGADPIADFPDAGLARRALESARFTVIVEILPTETVSLTDVVLPSVAYAEREGTFTNMERRLQKLEPLLRPPGSAEEPWRICARLAGVLGRQWEWHGLEDVWRSIRSQVKSHADIDLAQLTQEGPTPAPPLESGFEPNPTHRAIAVAGPGAMYPKGFRAGAPFQTGQNWPLSWELRAFEARQRPGVVPSAPEPAVSNGARPPPDRVRDGHGLVLLSGRMLYDEGAMMRRSAALRPLARKPLLEICADEARVRGISDGDEVIVSGAGIEARLRAVVTDICSGAVFVPYDQPGLRANTLMSGVDPRVEVRRASGEGET